MNKLNIDHKDVWTRAGKTFVQAAIASLIVTSSFSKAAVLSALAAGLSAAWNYLNSLNTTVQ